MRASSGQWAAPLRVLAAALGACAFCGCAEPPNVAQYQFDRGLMFYRNGDYRLAVAAYTEAIEQRPEYVDAYYERGLCHMRLGNLEAAIRDYTQAIDRRPEFQQAYNNRAVAYAQRQEYEKAVADCTKAIALNPNDHLAYRNRGLAYHDNGQLDKAIEDSTTAIRLDPASAEAYLNRGNAWLDKGGYEEAIADFTEAIDLDAELSKAYFSRAVAHAKRGDAAKASDDFRKAKQLNSAFDIPREYLALGDAQVQDPPAEVERPVAQPPAESRHAAIQRRAIEVAAERYRSEGYEVNEVSQTESFELECRKGQRTVYVAVKGDPDDGHTIRWTRDELRGVLDSTVAVDLVVVGHIGVEAGSTGATANGGRVVLHLRDWQPDASDMEPLTFEFRVPN